MKQTVIQSDYQVLPVCCHANVAVRQSTESNLKCFTTLLLRWCHNYPFMLVSSILHLQQLSSLLRGRSIDQSECKVSKLHPSSTKNSLLPIQIKYLFLFCFLFNIWTLVQEFQIKCESLNVRLKQNRIPAVFGKI